MGQFIIFLGAVTIFAIAGIIIWKIWNRVFIDIRRQESLFDIEKETHEKVKKRIKEDEEG